MNLFYELIQIVLGNREVLSRKPLAQDWQAFYELSLQQAVTGIVYDFLERRNNQKLKPPLEVLCQFISAAEVIKQQNLAVNKRCIEISKIFSDAGFRSCILKGQGNGRLYPNPLARIAGDIDLWVDADRKEINDFVHSYFPHEKGSRMHIEFSIFEDVSVEVHYVPRYMYAPHHDRWLQSFFREKADEQFSNLVTLEGAEGTCAVPTIEFNLVQQLSHMMSHFMGEGIGLRHFVDYYYVLKSLTPTPSPKGEGSDFQLLLKQMGLLKFAQGVMWVEKELLGLEEKYLIVEPSERIGRAIQQTIEEGGNFGHHNQLNVMRHQNMLGRAVGGALQSLRALHYFPLEASWKIIRKAI